MKIQQINHNGRKVCRHHSLESQFDDNFKSLTWRKEILQYVDSLKMKGDIKYVRNFRQ